MAPTKSRSQRKVVFEQAASAMYDRLEAWYDAHADASFEELEQEVRQERRAVNGRDAGHADQRARQWARGLRPALREVRASVGV